MKRLAAGRASEIYDVGAGRVLRRFLGGGDAAREALVMEHARRAGYPVPRVLEAQPDALVLERIEGPTMLTDLRARPWTAPRHARTLADLHRRLHAIAAPEALPAVGNGTVLVHLDLHPDNVLLAPLGPVVIDWTNARRGEGMLDAAVTWVICATTGRAGRFFGHLFRHGFDRAAFAAVLPEAVEFRLADRNLTEAEREAVARLLET